MIKEGGPRSWDLRHGISRLRYDAWLLKSRIGILHKIHARGERVVTVRPKVNSGGDQRRQEAMMLTPRKTRSAVEAPSMGTTVVVRDSIAHPAPDRSDRELSAVPANPVGTSIMPNSLLFNPDWYRKEYPDVAASGIDPVTHYLNNGAKEGRDPNQYFKTNWYVQHNPDVALAGLNPFIHYLLYGAREGRKPSS